MYVQSTDNTHSLNTLRIYPDSRTAAIVLLTSDEPGIQDGLRRVFQIHEAPIADLEEGLPWGADPVGDCSMTPDGAVLTIEGTGGSFLGMRSIVAWEFVSPSWRYEARANGCVWLGLPARPDYDEVASFIAMGLPVRLPAIPVLRLKVIHDFVT